MGRPKTQKAVSITTPVYIRQVSRKSDWEGNCFPIEQEDRIEHAWRMLFPPSEGCFSLFRAENDFDLMHIVAAINLGRSSPNQTFDFVPFEIHEIQAAEFTVDEFSLGTTECHRANRLHVDIAAEDQATFRRLCESAIQQDRKSQRVQKWQVAKMLDDLKSRGCAAFASPKLCDC